MSGNTAQLIRVMAIFLPLLFLTGFYCVIVTRNLIRTLIGLEILTKGVTLLLVVAGYLTGRTAFSQACVITMIVLEAVVLAVAAGIIVNAFQHTDSLDTRDLENLKG
jgi:multisubunit Na+/H+ antiporter MnhC subunit